MRIEPARAIQKMVEIWIFDGFLISLWSKYFLIFAWKSAENDVFRWKSFPAPMFDFGLYVCMIFYQGNKKYFGRARLRKVMTVPVPDRPHAELISKYRYRAPASRN